MGESYSVQVPNAPDRTIRRTADSLDGAQTVMNAMLITGHQVVAVLPETYTDYECGIEVSGTRYQILGCRQEGVLCSAVDGMRMYLEGLE